MANTRFIPMSLNKGVKTNPTATFPRFANGDTGNYTSPPALEQEPQYPLKNLLLPDLYTGYSSPIGTTPTFPAPHIVDLGSNQSISVIAILGLRLLAGAASPTSCVVAYSTAANGFGGAYTNVGTIVLSGTRFGAIVIAPVSARYWRFTYNFAETKGFAVGMLWLSSSGSDLGVVYSPGMDEMSTAPTVWERGGGGHRIVLKVGDTYSEITMPFSSSDDTLEGMLRGIFGTDTVFRQYPTLWMDQNDRPRLVLPRLLNYRRRHNWNPPNSWDVALELETLG